MSLALYACKTIQKQVQKQHENKSKPRNHTQLSNKSNPTVKCVHCSSWSTTIFAVHEQRCKRKPTKPAQFPQEIVTSLPHTHRLDTELDPARVTEHATNARNWMPLLLWPSHRSNHFPLPCRRNRGGGGVVIRMKYAPFYFPRGRRVPPGAVIQRRRCMRCGTWYAQLC